MLMPGDVLPRAPGCLPAASGPVSVGSSTQCVILNAVQKCTYARLCGDKVSENNREHRGAADGWAAWENYIWGQTTQDWSRGDCCQKGISPKSWPMQSCMNHVYTFMDSPL